MENEKSLAVIDTKTIEDYLFSTETKLNEQHKKLFLALAIRNQLDPFKREIYAVPYVVDGKTKLSVVTGYEVYLKRAERSGKLDGWKCWIDRDKEGLKALVEIKRKDWSQPFQHEVYAKEYDLGKALWKTKPTTMLKKVAIAQGFRLAFPEEIGGMPYTADELDIHKDKSEEITDVTATSSDVIDTTDMEALKQTSEMKCAMGIERISSIDNMFELKNHWKKHYKEYQSLLPEHFTMLEECKNKMKEKLEDK